MRDTQQSEGNGAGGDPAVRAFGEPSVIIPFVLVVLVWGSTWLVIKDQVSPSGVSVPPGWTVAYRFALATLGMFALACWRGDGLRLAPGGWRIAALIGVPQFFLNFQFVYRAEIYLTSGLVAVLYALLMVPNALFARVFLSQRITRGFLAGSAVAIAGIALLIAHEYRGSAFGGAVALGAGLTVAGILSASVANVAQAAAAARTQPFVPLLAWAMAIGTFCNVLFALAASGAPSWDPRWQYGAGIAYLALVGSVLTFPLYFRLIRAIGPGRAAYNGVAVPVVAMALSTLFEGYRWTALAIGGSALAIAGLVIALRSRR